MTLRLVLVSLVAGLGISLPSWPILESWVASSQKWMNARLAEWDNRQFDEQNYVVIHDLLKLEMEQARMERLAKSVEKRQLPLAIPTITRIPGLASIQTASLQRSAFTVRNAVALLPLPVEVRTIASNHRAKPEVVSTAQVEPSKPAPARFEPLVVGDRLYVGTAFELNYRNEGIGILPRVAVGPTATPAVQPADLLAVVVDRLGSTALRAARDLGHDLQAVAAVELAAREAAALEFEAMESSENLYFVDTPTTPVAAEPELVASLPSFEAMENSENLYFADVLVADASPVDSTPLESLVAVDVLPDDPFAPVGPASAGDPERVQQAGVAEPSGEAEESIESEVVAIRTVENSDDRRPEVSRAVRLTRDALYAWVNVLSDPPLVAVGPSTTTNR